MYLAAGRVRDARAASGVLPGVCDGATYARRGAEVLVMLILEIAGGIILAGVVMAYWRFMLMGLMLLMMASQNCM